MSSRSLPFSDSRKVTALTRSRPLRILMVAPTSFFSDYGGHIRILEETKALQARGHEIAIVTYYKGTDLPGLDIRRTPPLPWRPDYEVGSSRHKLAFDMYLAGQTLLEMWRMRPDVVHGHMHEGALIGGMLARLFRTPLLFDFQGGLTAEMIDHHFLDPDGLVYPWVYRLERFITRRLPDAILTSSLRAARLLRKEFKVPPDQIHPLPDCADVERFNPRSFSAAEKQALKQQLGVPDGRTVIAYLGLLTDYQGVPALIDTAVQLKESGEPVHYLIMGYPNVAYYRQMAQEKGVAEMITFTDKVKYRDAPYYLSLGEIAVAPKVSATEGSGKLLNYMAMAQPVVAFDTAVHREYLADLGVYAASGDVTAFSQRIRELVHNPEQRRRLGGQLRQRAQDVYSWQAAGRKIERVYQHLTSAPSKTII